MKQNELFTYLRNAKYNTIGADLQYRIEVDNENKVIRIMFQESSSKLDWIFNFYIPISFKNGKYLFSKGWRVSWDSGKQLVLETIKNKILEHPDYKVEVCGYSFGGAIAQICGIEIYENFGIKSDLTTFGSPKPLFGIISKLKAKRCFNSVNQYAHKNDIVTHCPPLPFYFSVKPKRLGKFKFKELFNPLKWHQIYDDDEIYK